MKNVLTPEELSSSLKEFGEGYKHASNYKAKLKEKKNIEHLLQCFERYKNFDNAFREFSTQINITNVVNAWNLYLSFIRGTNKDCKGNIIYSAQSKFESTIMEEVLFRIFKSYENDKIKVGGIKAYSNMYFSPCNFQDFQDKSNVKINTKDQDFTIYKQIEISINDSKKNTKAFIPVVAMECKTYLDKTMLEGSIATAEKIKQGNPYCRFCVVTESYDVDYSVDIKHSRIDQIYVLSKGKRNKSNKNTVISSDVVKEIYDETILHLQRKWSDVENNIKNHGKVL